MTATSTEKTIDELCVDTIRTLSMDAVQKANSGHPGAPMALAPLAYVLYTRIMKHNPRNPEWPDRDRFVLSAGHASMLLYSTLFLAGYGLTLDDIKQFRQLGSKTPGHPERGVAPGVECTTGPLGQGVGHSVGMALAERMLAARFNLPDQEVVDHHTFVIASDGDIQEGVASEASSFAGHLGLGRLIVFFDNNHVQLSGPTSDAFSEDVGMRYEAYGWHVQDVGEDLSLERLESATRTAMDEEERPSLIIVRSHIGFGAPHKQDTPAAHGSPLGEEEVRLAKEAYGWDPDKHFYVPEEALEHFRLCVQRGAEFESDWQQRFDAYAQQQPEKASEFKRLTHGELPAGWDSEIPHFHASGDMTATRKSSHEALQWAASKVPELVGGSADLSTSTLDRIDDAGDVEKPGSYAGRNLHFGVREHAMGAIVNGLTLHYLRGYGSTFFNFSDYMRGSIRMAAIMDLASIYVYTHDSIGLGEDGPTHQPIEQLAGLRAEPTLRVVRPSDANETALAWRYAIASHHHPTALVFSRQGVSTWNPSAVPDDAIERGAYVLRESHKEPEPPDLILISTGTEVHICTAAADLLEADGVATRVVSMPCWENFDDQDDAYRESVLPAAVKARVSVEAAATFGWDRWVGEQGEKIGMKTFGASAPYADLYEHFGFTPERVAEAGRAVVKRVNGDS